MPQNAYHTNSEELFSTLFADNYRQLCLYAFKYVNDRSAAEDIVQDSFMKVWNRWQEIRYDTALAYLYTCVRNAALKELNRGFQEVRQEYDIADSAAMQNVTEVETLNNIYAAITELPPNCRRIFDLMFVHGKTNPQIAEALRISESTIRSQKAKGIMLIKKRIQALYSYLLIFF